MSAKNFHLKSNELNSKKLSFSNSALDVVEEAGFLRLTTPEKGSTVDKGMPELPVYTSFFQMKPGVSYDVDYTVISSHVVSDVDVYPYQGEPVIGEERPFVKNSTFYNSFSI